jgi:4-amino-4-deoxy-L-arabinose transferase-like glycosyltransferase
LRLSPLLQEYRVQAPALQIETPDGQLSGKGHPPKLAYVAVLALAFAGTLGAFWGGPGLGDHEALVAQCARNMRVTGDWLVPQFLETPFIRKPPLPYWLVAASSYLFGNDPTTGLPVTADAARLPSALAGLGTVLLVWRLASRMFGRRAGLVGGALGGSCLFFLLYSPNATAEMLLTFFCTWAYLQFWLALRAKSPGWRRLHMLGFYVAMGLGMLAKGPAPLALVAAPLGVWWYVERPLRVFARSGPKGARLVLAAFVRGLWPRTREAFTRLWLIPGLLVFAAFFVPWMWAVAQRHPHAWDLWNWQYFQRAQGNYEDSRPRDQFYYLPFIPALIAPWVFLLPEAMVAPWLRWYAAQRRALLYAGLWGLIGIVIMSLEPFKKPYYIAPAVPALVLLMTVVAERFFTYKLKTQVWGPLLLGGMAVGLALALVAGWWWLQQNTPAMAGRLTVVGVVAAAGLLGAGAVYIRGRGWAALAIMSVASVGTFNFVWHNCGATLDDMEQPTGLAQGLDAAGVPRDAAVYWADSRPDSRVSFYFDRTTQHMLKPEVIVSAIVDRTRGGRAKLEDMVLERGHELMNGPTPVYLILERESYAAWKMAGGMHGYVVAEVKREPSRKDWLVVSNRPPSGGG